jgi:hypothetical protein
MSAEVFFLCPLLISIIEASMLKKPEELNNEHVKGQKAVLLVDSVVNSGKSVEEFVQHIRALNSTIRIVVIAGPNRSPMTFSGIQQVHRQRHHRHWKSAFQQHTLISIKLAGSQSWHLMECDLIVDSSTVLYIHWLLRINLSICGFLNK